MKKPDILILLSVIVLLGWLVWPAKWSVRRHWWPWKTVSA